MKTYPYKKERTCITCGRLTDTQNQTSECSKCFLEKVAELREEESP